MYAIIVLLAVFVLSGLIPIKFAVEYDADGIKGCLRILFVKLFFPKKNEKIKKEKKKEMGSTEKRPGDLKKLIPIIEPALKALGQLVQVLKIKKLVADITLAGKDAFETAILYGGTTAILGCIFPFVDSNLKIKKKYISVKPDFTVNETTVYFYADITILIWQLVIIAIHFSYKYLKKILKVQKKGNKENG